MSSEQKRGKADSGPSGPEVAARVLIGWVDPAQAALWLTGRRPDIRPTADQEQFVVHARAAIAARPAGLDQSQLEQCLPHGLKGYLARLQADPAAANLLSSGWNVSMVDLARVCAAQPMVHVGHAEQRTIGADAGDPVSLAHRSLPISNLTELPARFDQAQKAWIFSSANPNLRVSQAQHAVVNGVPIFGFTIALLASFVRVARYRSRYVLVDGYHRAYGFLRRSITCVPALVGDVSSFEALGLPTNGMLSQEAYLGDRPPTLADYLNDDVSIEVQVPATQRMIVLPALEMMVG